MSTRLPRRATRAAAAVVLFFATFNVVRADDVVILGDAASERAHGFADARSERVADGALGDVARRLLPPEKDDWQGGSLRVTLAVDPARPNYLTARFWGGEASESRVIAFVDGKQLGYRHLGDIDILDFGNEGKSGGAPGRFYYVTTPLPESATKGKTSVEVELRSTGRTWGYGTTFESYQRAMTMPSHAIYRLYTHLAPRLVPAADERQGAAPTAAPVAASPGPEVLDAVKKRIDDELARQMTGKQPLPQQQVAMLARAYRTSWTIAHDDPRAIARIVDACDAYFAKYKADPKFAINDPSTPNPDWFGLGLAGEAIRLVAPQLRPKLDETLPGSTVTRRAAWSEMLQYSRDWNRRNRRLYTNQTMIKDLNVYRANRALEAIDPSHAMPEADVLRYLYESLGLQPWTDSDPGGDAAAETGRKTWGVGDNYMQLTAKGLTKELGFVGYYGEVIDWATQIYDATREPGEEGDARIKAQLVKIAHARAPFRYPALDDAGNRAMRIETIIGWRDMHYPGDIVYGERPSWDATALYEAAATLDPTSVAYARQMIDDNQFFASLDRSMKEQSGIRTTVGLMGAVDQYAAIERAPKSDAKLPMTSGQPDFVFSDEEDGVVAVKDGETTLYVSLYWRARNAVNFLARVHEMTPTADRIATVREDVAFAPSGQFYTRPDVVNFGFANGGPKYPVEMHSLHAGERLPIAKVPAGTTFKPGDESVYAGKGERYTLRYGDYLIAMNMRTDKTFDLAVPADAPAGTVDLVSKRPARAGETLTLAPRTTAVLRLR